MLNRESILGAEDLPREKVLTPEWGAGTFVYVGTMSGAERDSFEQTILEDKKADGKAKLVNVRAKLAVRVVQDEQGQRLFTDDDAEALGRKSAKVLDRIFDVGQRLNGIGAKDVKELEGNS